jgi:phage-related protein
MNNASGGNVIYHFKGDTKDLNKATKEVEGKFGGLGKLGKGALVGVGVAAGAATAALVGMTKDSVKAYASVEQSIGGVETLFKDSADTVIANAKRAYETAGVDANTYMEQITSFSASLLQSVGGDTVKAAKTGDMAIRDMSDNANKFGTSIDSIQNAYQGFAKQNYTMLDNLKLGYGGTKEEMQRLLADAEKLTGKKYDISNLDDVYKAIHAVQEELGITGTTAKEAGSTISGSVGSAKAAWENFLSGQGGIEQVISTFTTAGKNIANAVIKMLPQLVQGITGLINGLLPLLPGLIKALLPPLVKGIITLTKGIIELLPEIIRMIADILPELMPMIVEGIYEIIPMLIKMTPEFIKVAILLISALIKGFVNSMPKVLQGVKNIIKTAIQTIVNLKSQFLQKGKEIIINLVNGIRSVAANPKQAVRNLITNIKNLFSSAGGWLWNAGRNIIQGLLNGIVNKAGSVINYAHNLADRIKNTIAKALKIHSPSRITMYQGEMTAEGYMVGLDKMRSQLQEAVYDTFSLSPQFTNASALHYSPSVVVNNNVSMETDPLGQTVSKIKTFAGGAKNDYNYGVGV